MPRRLYTEDHAQRIRESGRTKYRPANGTEGLMFMERWCEQCSCYSAEHSEEPDCAILSASFWNDIDDPDYPTEWTYDETGQPRCTAFVP